jgi:DNA recombination protein RmuC
MGFRTLAVEQRTSEVWKVLGAVKTEFGKFGDVLARTRQQLQTVSRSLDTAEVRSRAIVRTLRGVEELPAAEASELLPEAGGPDAPHLSAPEAGVPDVMAPDVPAHDARAPDAPAPAMPGPQP